MEDDSDVEEPFLAHKSARRPSAPFRFKTRILSRGPLICLCLILVSCIVVSLTLLSGPSYNAAAESTAVSTNTKVHFLLPATQPDLQLCKTALTAAVLDFPTPVLLGWDKLYESQGEMAGGSHMGKIVNTLKYLDALCPSRDSDLVLMTDAYDVWFQLRLGVLLERYSRLNAEAELRLVRRLGRTAKRAGKVKQTIIFAAGKRCAPNQPHTIACYPLPEPPSPKDLYFENTDTIIGRNKYYSHRQKYLNSGYILGPVGDMRLLFQRAYDEAKQQEAIGKDDPNDNGSHGSDFMYHGSDQSIFNAILGEQEYMREVIRRRNLGLLTRIWAWMKLSSSSITTSGVIEGTIVDDVLNPSFTHEIFEPEPGKQYEFGIGLDYSSDIGHQTVNSEQDGHWLNYTRELQPQIPDRNRFDCKLRLPTIPEDILASETPLAMLESNKTSQEHVDWVNVPLYTHVCYGKIPIIIHHNGNKNARNFKWHKNWFYGYLREMAEKLDHQAQISQDSCQSYRDFVSPTVKSSPICLESRPGGAWSASSRKFVRWQDMCPGAFDDDQLFQPQT